MEKIFLTGGTGFIGKSIAKRLADSGYIVHVLYRTLSKASDFKHPNIKLFEGDLFNIPQLEKAMTDCSGVIHMAAFAKPWSKNKKDFYDINYTGTINLLDIALKIKVQKFVFTSTTGVLGPSDSGQTIDETTVRKVKFYFEYERTKWLAEEKIKEYIQKGLDIIIVSPTRVFGPGLLSQSNSLTSMIKSYVAGTWHMIPGNGKTIANYVFVDDVVSGHILAFHNGKSGEKYILGGHNITYNEFFEIVAKMSGKQYQLTRIPRAVMIFMSWIMMFFTFITGKPPKITPALVRKFLDNCLISSEKARNELGYQPTSMENGIKETIEWLVNGN